MYVVYTLGMTGPVLQITNATIKATWKEVDASLKNRGIETNALWDGSLLNSFLDKLKSKTDNQQEKVDSTEKKEKTKFTEKDIELKSLEKKF